MAKRIGIDVDRGATYTKSFIYKDSEGDPFDFTGYSGTAQLKKGFTSSTAWNFTVALGADGSVSLYMPASLTGTIPAGRYVYDVIATNADTYNVIKVQEGIATVNPLVTGDSSTTSTTHSGATVATLAIQPVNGVLTFNCALATEFFVLMNQNVTSVVIQNRPQAGQSQRIAAYFQQDSTGGRVITGWPAGTQSPAGITPVLSTVAGALDLAVLELTSTATFLTLVARGYNTIS